MKVHFFLSTILNFLVLTTFAELSNESGIIVDLSRRSSDTENATYANQFSAAGAATMSSPDKSPRPALISFATSSSQQKPAVGSDEWLRIREDEWNRTRKDIHKESERRRREYINAGINELARIVPGCISNKGAIIQRTVQYIQQLQKNEATNNENWNFEKLLMDQAINEYQMHIENLKQELDKARLENAALRGKENLESEKREAADDGNDQIKKVRTD